MSGIQYVTKETLEQMKSELQQLRSVERPAASRAIAEAREKGDLKENAEYDAAKEAQGLLEAKIANLEGQIATARIIDEATIDTSKVSILTKVKVTNMNTKKQVTYQIVSEKEADLMNRQTVHSFNRLDILQPAYFDTRPPLHRTPAAPIRSLTA